MEDSELEIKNIEDKVATNTGNIATNAADIATYHPGTVQGCHKQGSQGGQFLPDQLILSQPGETHYAHQINTCHPRFSHLASALSQSCAY